MFQKISVFLSIVPETFSIQNVAAFLLVAQIAAEEVHVYTLD